MYELCKVFTFFLFELWQEKYTFSNYLVNLLRAVVLAAFLFLLVGSIWLINHFKEKYVATESKDTRITTWKISFRVKTEPWLIMRTTLLSLLKYVCQTSSTPQKYSFFRSVSSAEWKGNDQFKNFHQITRTKIYIITIPQDRKK